MTEAEIDFYDPCLIYVIFCFWQ